MLTVVCPGQGSQRFLSGALPFPIPDGANIDDTANAQPLIVAAALSSYCQSGIVPTMVAGHSVGMLAAFAIAGCYSFETAIELAKVRGRIFHDVAASSNSGMSALIGKNVTQMFRELDSVLEVAVVNSDSQIVVAGLVSELDKLSESVPRGIRVTRLPVSGAFHTSAMLPAVAAFGEVLNEVKIVDPSIPVISDLTGEILRDGIKEHLLTQITNSVHWDLVTAQLRKHLANSDESDEIVELAPSGTLSALLKHNLQLEHVKLKCL
jgi:[acyl-carrier-protein] S-malonyltransferase